MRVFSYHRCSSKSFPAPEKDLTEIMAAGFEVELDRMVSEQVSVVRSARNRPGFMKLLDRMEKGDTLVVTKLDRLGRSALDIRSTVVLLAKLGLRVHCLTLGNVDLTGPAGRMTMGIVSAMAEFELDVGKERSANQSKRAEMAGRMPGRPSKTTLEHRVEILNRLASGVPVAEIARQFGVSRAVVQDIRDPEKAAARYARRKIAIKR